MFDRFVKLAEARRALKEGRLLDSLRLAEDPLVERDRRARQLRDRILDAFADRVQRGLDKGNDPDAIDRDLEVLAQRRSDDAAVAELRAAVADARRRGNRLTEERGRVRRQAEQLLRKGEIDRAENLIEEEREAGLDASFASVLTVAGGQRRAASDHLGAAARALDAGRVEDAVHEISQARAKDADVAGADALGKKVARRLVPEIERVCDRASRDPAGARTAWLELRDLCARLPELEAEERLVRASDNYERACLGRAVESVREGRFDEAWTAVAEDLRTARVDGPLEQCRSGIEAVQAAHGHAARGDFSSAADALGAVGAPWSCKALDRWRKQLRDDADEVTRELAAVRALVDDGKVSQARHAIVNVRRRWPSVEIAGREERVLDALAKDRAQRMDSARELIGEGRLGAAEEVLLTLTTPGSDGDEARALLEDVRARMETTASQFRKVLRSLHGQEGASIDGLRSCCARLEELCERNQDDPEVQRWIRQVRGEITIIEASEGAGQRLRDVPVRTEAVAAAVGEIRSAVDALPEPDRVRARLDRTMDAGLRFLDRSIDAGQADLAMRVANALRPLATLHSDRERSLDERSLAAQDRLVRAESTVRSARVAWERERDRAAAADALDEARAIANDAPGVQSFERELRGTGDQDRFLRGVEEMVSGADPDDAAAAARALREMGPTPAGLRTRVFDLKRDIAKAQGLERLFVLRVDEGGEFLVARQDSITIGNVRDGRADLPILASLAGVHARIRRSMSFHGGMEDRILAHDGTMFVGGRDVDSHVLRDGDEVQLGKVVSLRYTLASSRSLTATLRLGSPFQIAGTDTILLLKDRGRDGRILIGNRPDSHVRVPKVEDELELFVGRDGQVRVRFAGQGEIDGRPFQGEHPVTPGAYVRCGGVGFVLHPWAADRG